jgi:hypothetical protein
VSIFKILILFYRQFSHGVFLCPVRFQLPHEHRLLQPAERSVFVLDKISIILVEDLLKRSAVVKV